jgi:cytochrome c oxidase cbb3-type subunit III
MKFRVLVCTALVAVGCERTQERAGWDGRDQDRAVTGDVTEPHVRTTTFQAGGITPRPRIANPYADAADEGERFYIAFNCAGCHGARGGGGIGPPLARESFIYGNDPQNIFQTIVQGRPYGMPAYGGKAPDEVIWKIAAYVRHLSAPGSPEPGTGPGESDEDTP